MLTPAVSQKLKFWSFVSMVFLVFVHGYNLDIRYMQPGTVPGEPMTVSSFLEYFIANGILRFRIPMLFVISGFLYALHDHKPNRERMPKRLRTLLAPYLIWSAVGLLMTYLLELYGPIREMIIGSHIAQIDETRMTVHEYHWYETLARWVFFPVSYQLWFIRVLLVYNAAYPLLRKWVTHDRNYIFFGIAIFLWLMTANVIFIDGEGLLFFSLGIWLQKTSFDIENPSRRFNPMPWGLAFVVLTVVKTWLAFIGGPYAEWWLVPMHKVVVVAGLVFAWFSSDALVSWCMARKWFVWLSSFSFIIYALHAPLVAFLIDASLDVFKPMAGFQLMAFVALPLAIILFCILVGWILRSLTPKFYGLLTGGRGM